MSLTVKICDELNLDACLVRAYYSNVLCRFHDEDGSIMERLESTKNLYDEVGYFSMDVDGFVVKVTVERPTIIVDIM